jgi:hypothetical protein
MKTNLTKTALMTLVIACLTSTNCFAGINTEFQPIPRVEIVEEEVEVNTEGFSLATRFALLEEFYKRGYRNEKEYREELNKLIREETHKNFQPIPKVEIVEEEVEVTTKGLPFEIRLALLEEFYKRGYRTEKEYQEEFAKLAREMELAKK